MGWRDVAPSCARRRSSVLSKRVVRAMRKRLVVVVGTALLMVRSVTIAPFCDVDSSEGLLPTQQGLPGAPDASAGQRRLPPPKVRYCNLVADHRECPREPCEIFQAGGEERDDLLRLVASSG